MAPMGCRTPDPGVGKRLLVAGIDLDREHPVLGCPLYLCLSGQLRGSASSGMYW